MHISLLTIPVEVDYMEFDPQSLPGTDVFVASTRSEGQLPVMPKIAIVSLIKWMERHGYSKNQYDFYDVDMLLPSDEDLKEYFKSYNPTVVGLSAVVSTCYAQVKRISAILRQACPEAWIVLGGSLTASSPMVLSKTDVDICVVGDGEITWVDFLNYVKANGRRKDVASLKGIVGLSFLDNDGELYFTGYGKAIPSHLNPFPDYDILQDGLKEHSKEILNYFRPGLGSTHVQTDPRSYEPHRRPMLAQLWSSKGCVARCTFCQRSTKGYRVMGVESLDEHLQLLAERFNVGFIHILDENFASNKKYVYEFARAMKKYDMLWFASGVRVSSVDYEDIKFFKEHGCVSLKFGVESGSQKIMDIMEKKFTVDRVFQTLKHCADLELYSPLAVMVGMPGETCETAAETGRFLGRIAHAQGIDPRYLGLSVFYALPLPGTPLFLYGQQIGVIGKTAEGVEQFLIEVSGSGASKVNYINLNGAKIKDVIWWDWIVKLEAQRTFFVLSKSDVEEKKSFLQDVIISDKKREIIGRAFSLRDLLGILKNGDLRGLRVKMFFAIGNFMENTVVPSRFAAMLPRWFIYPILKNLVYVEFLMQKTALKILGRSFNLMKEWNPVTSVESTSDNDAGESVDINRSLRRQVQNYAKKHPPYSQTDATNDTLSIGL